ncbi:hypothetical protein DNH61_14595 [Paenibacillus sambharensis]|uniref:Uncharacterized protein n=1 Tax=Paenibacillus sambharensis TaxID=1803190 RepID=A0A2W1L776_9BACL|nr:hypothetical protein [Paenibacillus sambharensis]PZD95116.1 hypothetical protein DNH61_14595 [Paenibacillus sambharensis]
MTNAQHEHAENIISSHSRERWIRRKQELAVWVERDKLVKKPKQTVGWDDTAVDAELLPALQALRRAGIQTEFSCAGVSLLDEPFDHSLYAYVTCERTRRADQFVQHAIKQMRHRLLVTLEPANNRYDLSSFFIMHNRSFCLQLERAARQF